MIGSCSKLNLNESDLFRQALKALSELESLFENLAKMSKLNRHENGTEFRTKLSYVFYMCFGSHWTLSRTYQRARTYGYVYKAGKEGISYTRKGIKRLHAILK